MHFVYENRFDFESGLGENRETFVCDINFFIFRLIWIDSLVGVVTNNFSIKLDAENDTKNTNTNTVTVTTNNNSDDVKNKEQPSTEALFDQKDPTVFEEVEKKSEMTLKSQIDPLVKPTNLYSTVTVGTA